MPDERTGRLFLALWPDDGTRNALHAWQLACAWASGARPTAAHDLHLTLHFIGAVAVAQLPSIVDAAKVSTGPIALTFDQLETWRGGLLVCTSSAPPPAGLQALHRSLAEALGRLNLPLDQRPYRPHVTLARSAAATVVPRLPQPIRWSSRGHVLATSEAGRYRVLHEVGC